MPAFIVTASSMPVSSRAHALVRAEGHNDTAEGTSALVARLNEQEARIQNVSAQVEMRKSGSQMLVENQ